ncbi:TerB family tellurite resistance protein, partial [Frankia sp. CpI1-P]
AGRHAALAEIAKVRGRVAQAVAVVRIGQVIGLVDGEFVASERAVVREAALALGLEPAEFAL